MKELLQFAEVPQISRFYSALIGGMVSSTDESEFLTQVLNFTQQLYGGEGWGVYIARSGRWAEVGKSSQTKTVPQSLLADVLDCSQSCHTEQWYAAPLLSTTNNVEVVVAHDPNSLDTAPLELIEAVAMSLSIALGVIRLYDSAFQRSKRLEALLTITSDWNRTQEMEPLLLQMAETATELFKSDRASIFLWDRANKLLIGRPALGVEGNELRIADDVGIVGQVVHHGKPRRVNSEVDQQEVDRQVDEKLGYQTNSLLCVPLRSPEGDILGAFELINKLNGDFTDEDELGLTELAQHAAVALQTTQQMEDLLETNRQLIQQAADEVNMIGQSEKIEELRGTIDRVADTELAILVLGENGTGKEVVSQSIHYQSRRRSQPFVAINCAAIAETLLESELFGHEKGAFTDAHEAKVGKFEFASGGTIFLDEIGDLSLNGQSKLLRVLEEKVVVRVGGTEQIHVDCRVIAATNQNLAEMVSKKKFREDLYYRLNVVSLMLPPLRERGEDIILLADFFFTAFCSKARRKRPTFTAAAKKRLIAHTWPGNVRELRNLMERLAYLAQGDKIDADDLAFILSPSKADTGGDYLNLPMTEATSQFQIDYINQNIDRAAGNVSEAASRMGMHRSNLYRKMRQLGMSNAEE